MISYLLKTMLCSGLLLLVYRFFLQGEKMYRFNRFYLLFSIAFSFVVPFIPMSADTTFSAATDIIPEVTVDMPYLITVNQPETPTLVDYWPLVMTILYLTGCAFFLCRFLVNFFILIRSLRRHPRLHSGKAVVVLTDDNITPHSFFRYIFINRQVFSNGAVEKEIMQHELTHVKQLHSLDVLLMEILLTVCWINPLLFVYRKMIRLNHEFLADEAVINTYHDTPSYQYLLLHTLSKGNKALLSSSFNYLITKKRLVMMNKPTNRTAALVKQVAMLPVLAGMVFLFSTKTYAQEPVKQQPPTQPQSKPEKKAASGAKVPEALTFAPKVPFGPGATEEQLTEYDAVINRIVTTSPTKDGRQRTNIDMKDVDIKRMATIFKQMNEQQRSLRNSTVGRNFVFLSTPHKKSKPTTTQLQTWADASQYGVWIDGKRTDNSELAKYPPADFVHYFQSRLSKNAVNYGKHYFQVELYTKAHQEPAVTKLEIVQ
jgi:bla regulator protein BlaR1